MDDLTSRDLLEDTVVIITSDHGEGFFEHGRGGHGSGVYEELVHVPLLICHPRSLGEGRWVETETEAVDLFPTMTDLVGLPHPETAQGTSLLPLMLDPTPVMNRPAFSYHGDFMRGLRIGRWKTILSGESDPVYDLEESPLEGEDRSATVPIVQRYLRDVAAFHLALDDRWHKDRWGFANNHSAELAAWLDEQLW
jgi:arylsulfatase A-like enzyme